MLVIDKNDLIILKGGMDNKQTTSLYLWELGAEQRIICLDYNSAIKMIR